MRYQITEGDSVRVYDGFIRECPLLDRVYPAQATTTGYPDAFFVKVCLCMCVCVCVCASLGSQSFVYLCCRTPSSASLLE